MVAKKMSEGDKVDREMAVVLLQRLNKKLHDVHKSYFLPWLLLVVSGGSLIFVKEKTEG